MRLERYIRRRRRFYRQFLCPSVNNPTEGTDERQYPLWNGATPGWKRHLPEDPDFPVLDVADAIKNCVRGEEDVDSEAFQRGARILLGMETKYRPRDQLTVYQLSWHEPEEGHPVPVISEPTTNPMLGFRFASGLHWEGFGEYSNEWSAELVQRERAYLEADALDDTPMYRPGFAPGDMQKRLDEDLEYGVYRIKSEFNPEWVEASERFSDKADKRPVWSESVHMFLGFRVYLRWDRLFLHLGVCHHRDCEKLYVKSGSGWSTQRYCPRHQRYHRSP